MPRIDIEQLAKTIRHEYLCIRYSGNNRGILARFYCVPLSIIFRQKQSETNFENPFLVTAPTVDVKNRFHILMFMNTFENKSSNSHVTLFVCIYGELSSICSTKKLGEERQKTKNRFIKLNI